MDELLQNVTSLGGRIDTGLTLAKWGLVVVAAGVAVYLLRTVAGMLRPAVAVVRWLLPVTPGVAAGLSAGARMLTWAAIIGVGIWFSVG